MSQTTSLIPPAGKIDVPDAPRISSVELVQQVIENICAQVSLLDIEIFVAQQDDTGLLKSLFENIHEIKEKAEQARSVLRTISDNPETLEYANARMEEPSDLLHKINHLVESVRELEEELSGGEFDYYRTIAELLIDVQQQMAYFDAYGAIPHIKLIRDKLQAIQSELRRQVQWSFREIGQLVTNEGAGEDGTGLASPSNDLTSLSQVYLVVEALGLHFRKDLLERFAQLQLIPYEKLFCAGTKFTGLEHLDKRFAWFKRLLAVADSRLSSIFPKSWNLPRQLFIEFSRRTKKHLSDVLSALEKSKPELATHVQMLLKSLKYVLAFEAEMTASFAVFARGEEDAEVATSGDGEGEDRGGRPSSSSVGNSNSIAEVFDAFLGPYVQMEREEIEKLMKQLMQDEESGTLEETEGPLRPREPFVSSRKMFEFIKKSLKRCTSFSNGQTYLSLSKEFRICLHNYAESLKFRCPSPVKSANGGRPVYVFTAAQVEIMCHIICTGEYCIDTVPPLEAIMKKTISPELQDEIDFAGQQDAYTDLVSYTTNIMTEELLEKIRPALKTMRSTNWAVVDMVGDESMYVKEMKGILSEAIVRIRNFLSVLYFQNFCMKLVTVVLDSLLASVWKLKRIGKTGAGQLLMDLSGIREYLLRMPNARLEAGQEAVPMPKAYNTVVNSRIHNIEVILKLLCTDDDKLNETFAQLWPDGKQSDLDAIVALKSKTSLAEVGELFKDGAKELGQHKVVVGAKNVVSDFNKGIRNVFGDMKAVMTGNLLSEDSGHNAPVASGHPSSGGGGGGGDKAAKRPSLTGHAAPAPASNPTDSLKNAFNSSFAFMKAGAGAGGGTK